MMDSTTDQLKVAFLPFAAAGHLIPLMNTARLFARHGVDVTFITTPASAVRFREDVDRDSRCGYNIKIYTLRLPWEKVGLPPGVESFTDSTSLSMSSKLGTAFEILYDETEQLLREMKTDCIVSDMILYWTTDAAARLGIPRLVFLSSGCVPECLAHSVKCYKPHEKVGSDEELFVLPGLPHKIEMTRSQLPFWLCTTDEIVIDHTKKAQRAREESYGVLANTLYELEADYVEHFKSALGFKTWVVGPVSFWVNRDVSKDSGLENNGELMEWLNSKESNSVLYVCFGSTTKLPSTQLLEIAHGLEDSGHQFIWVVGKMNESEGDGEAFPEGFEERMKQSERGFIIRTWAPQHLILNHPAIGGFVTHCGWNSVLESVCAGLPMITWPSSVEQFFNEKLVTHVLKIGVSVGAKKARDLLNLEAMEIVARNQISKAVSFLMGDEEEASRMRNRARELAFAAERATSNGGSSHNSLVSLMEELKTMKLKRQSHGLHAHA